MNLDLLKPYAGMVMDSYLSNYPLGFRSKDDILAELRHYDQFIDWLPREEGLSLAETYEKHCGQYHPFAIFGHQELEDLTTRLGNDAITEWVFDGSPSESEFIVALGPDDAVYVWEHESGFEQKSSSLTEFLQALKPWEEANEDWEEIVEDYE